MSKRPGLSRECKTAMFIGFFWTMLFCSIIAWSTLMTGCGDILSPSGSSSQGQSQEQEQSGSCKDSCGKGNETEDVCDCTQTIIEIGPDEFQLVTDCRASGGTVAVLDATSGETICEQCNRTRQVNGCLTSCGGCEDVE
jgi:hypothetical protein